MKKITKVSMINKIEKDVYGLFDDIVYDANELIGPDSELLMVKIACLQQFKMILKNYESSKVSLIKKMNMKDDLKQHEMAVFLNIDCNVCYDIAKNISDYL